MRISDGRVAGDLPPVRLKRVRLKGVVEPTTAIEEFMAARG